MTQPAKNYYRVMLGRQRAHVAECLAGGFIGSDYKIHHQDLTGLRWTMTRSCVGPCWR
jgi:restriction system protein